LELNRFINFYNTVKPHKSLNNATPYEILSHYFELT
ncbi:IS481 family transposase, partial [Cardiobacteriales bacterium ML27]|nr:IS481 family transposase [Ostreibacterium oceani]